MEIKSPIKAIRAKCIDCSGGNKAEVRKCVIPECPLFPFRMGKNPFRKPLTEEQREARRRSAIKNLVPTARKQRKQEE